MGKTRSLDSHVQAVKANAEIATLQSALTKVNQAFDKQRDKLPGAHRNSVYRQLDQAKTLMQQIDGTEAAIDKVWSLIHQAEAEIEDGLKPDYRDKAVGNFPPIADHIPSEAIPTAFVKAYDQLQAAFEEAAALIQEMTTLADKTQGDHNIETPEGRNMQYVYKAARQASSLAMLAMEEAHIVPAALGEINRQSEAGAAAQIINKYVGTFRTAAGNAERYVAQANAQAGIARNGATRVGVRSIQAKPDARTSAMKATLRYGEMSAPVQITSIRKRKDGRTVIRVKASGPLQASVVEAMQLYEKAKPMLADATTLNNRVTTIYELIRSYRNNLSDAQEQAITTFRAAQYNCREAISKLSGILESIRRINDLNKRAMNDPEGYAKRQDSYASNVQEAMNEIKFGISRGEIALMTARQQSKQGDALRRQIPEGLNG